MSLARYLSGRTLAIFLFHGVVEEHVHPLRNYTRKHLDREYFATCLGELKRSGSALGMDEVANHCLEGEPFPPGAFAVTFDDGFENNYSVAAPVLADLNIPAAFYVTTGFVDHNAMSWIDRMEYCLEACMETVGRCELDLPWNEAPAAVRSNADACAALQEIRERVKHMPELDVDGLVESLFEQCGIPSARSSDDPLDRKMTWEQVAALHADPLFTVGGHTHTHAIMSFLDPAGLSREIDRSLELLRDRADVETNHYSYPEGLEHCFNEEVIRQLKQRGVTCCPTAIHGVNDHAADPFRLRRIMVGCDREK